MKTAIQNSKVCLLDPSMSDNQGNPSRNLGDLIIYDAVTRVFSEIFPGVCPTRVSSQVQFGDQELARIRPAKHVILGGTNALCSSRGGHTWYWDQSGLFFLAPKVRQVILLGVGWGTGYPNPPSTRMRLFYKRSLSSKMLHSVRDQFTCTQLQKMGFRNVVNTGCPTTWNLDGVETLRSTRASNCLFTLTDYSKDLEADNSLIQFLAEETAGRSVYFPQGDGDLAYIQALAAFERHKMRIEILPREYRALTEFVSNSRDFFYVGTRLHCGILCLQHNWDALILAVDNRAREMGNDFHLPVVERIEFDTMRQWIRKDLSLGRITLPLATIATWKAQFSSP